MKFQCLFFSFVSIAESQLPSVFVSYRQVGEQKVFAKKFVEQLKERNISAWIDVDCIAVGDKLVPAITEAINKSDIFVCVLSDEFFASKYCQNEFDFADNAKKRLFPIKWNDSSFPDEYRFTFDRILHHTYNPQENPDAELQKCVEEFMKLAKSKLYNY